MTTPEPTVRGPQPAEHETQVLDLRGRDHPDWPNQAGEEAYWSHPEPGWQSEPPAAQAEAGNTFIPVGAPGEPGLDASAVGQPDNRRGFGGSWGVVFALLASAGFAGVIASLPTLAQGPMGQTREWAIVYNLLDVDGPRTLATWWGTALYVLAGVWAWAAGQRARLARRRARWVSWGWVGLMLVVMSGSHMMSLHTQLAGLESIRGLGLPNPVVNHPVEIGLAVLVAIPGLVLLVTGRNRQRVLLAAGALIFVLGTFVLGGNTVTVSTNGQYQHVAEVGLEWLGLCLVMLAAALERKHR